MNVHIFTFMQIQFLTMRKPNPTDRDRVRWMFQHLRTKRGLYSRMALGDATSSALAHLSEIVPTGHPYCFFHGKDEEAFGKDGYLIRPLFISWGIVADKTTSGTPEQWISCAEKVVTAGILAGLQVTWEGTAQKRIAVHPTRPSMALAAPALHSVN